MTEPESTIELETYRPKPDYTLACSNCGSQDVAPVPYIQTGMGVAYRDLNDYIHCSHCNRMMEPALKLIAAP